MFTQVIGTLAHKKALTRGQSIKKPGAMAGRGVGGLPIRRARSGCQSLLVSLPLFLSCFRQLPWPQC